MKFWNVNLQINGRNLGNVEIKKGIFQGDSLSSTWFCLSLNPLSPLLDNSENEYRIDKKETTRISHLLYIDDLKLFAETKYQLLSLINTTKVFSKNICMKLGIDKCAITSLVKGKFVHTNDNATEIPGLFPHQSYKYLGFQQRKGLEHSMLKRDYTY